jgi:hypothetical protein
VREALLSRQFHLLTEIRLSELLDPRFIATFIQSSSSSYILMSSHNTRIDCDDCACLLPGGLLVLSLTRATHERLPQLKILDEPTSGQKTRNKLDANKFELSLDLSKLVSSPPPRPPPPPPPLNATKQEKKEEEEEIALLGRIFDNMSFTFYVTTGGQSKQELSAFFGESRVLECAFRVEANIHHRHHHHHHHHHHHNVKSSIESLDLSGGSIEDWLECENTIGCVINQVEMDRVAFRGLASCSSKTATSVLRVKGFLSNAVILQQVLTSREIFEFEHIFG